MRVLCGMPQSFGGPATRAHCYSLEFSGKSAAQDSGVAVF